MLKLTTATRALLVGLAFAAGLAGGAFALGPQAQAQLVVEPEALSVSVPRFETATETVVLTNAGSEPLAFCLSFDRPLQRPEVEGAALRLSETAVGGGAPCGHYGAVLARFDEGDFGAGWGPTTLTMVPGGRLFIVEGGGGLPRTFEFTADLSYVRTLTHPTIAELTPFAATNGIAFALDGAGDTGTLWWMNVEQEPEGNEIITRRVLLLEGDLDGDATGQQIEVTPPQGLPGPFLPLGLSYDPATDLFFFTGQYGGTETRALWAVDRSGQLADGYPAPLDAYPVSLLGSPDVHGGPEGGPIVDGVPTPGAEGVRAEMGLIPNGEINFDRVVVLGRFGHYLGEELETPVPEDLFVAGGAGIRGNPLRSRIDPNGAMYMTFTNFEDSGVVAVRPHPLPPSWLAVDSDAGAEAAWGGVLAPGESREVTLTFRAGARALGLYTSSLQAFAAESGAAVEVPLALMVAPAVDVEDEAGPADSFTLAVYPNPARGTVTVAMTLGKRADVRVAVFDVLGRRVAVLHEGREAGRHTFALEGTDLPSGTYLVRAEVGAASGSRSATKRIMLVR